MSDNIAVTAGSGTTIATDDIGSVHYQKIEQMKKRSDDTIVDSWYDSGTISNADIDTIEDVATIDVTGFTNLFISFLVGTATLTAFRVDFRVHSSGDWFNIASVGGDYTFPAGPMLGASGDLTVAASGSTVHWLKLDVTGVQAVRLQAAGTSSTITGHYGAN